MSAFNDESNPYSIMSTSDNTEVLKIHRSYFLQYFGGLSGGPVTHVRSIILVKRNWLNIKVQFLNFMTLEELNNLTYRNEEKIE